MAQPLEKPDYPTVNGIDEAAARMDQAFQRLEKAASRASASHHSLKAENEKLNLLLQSAEKEIAHLKQVVQTVSVRLDHTIAVLEKMDA